MHRSTRLVLSILLIVATVPWTAARSDAGRLADDGRAGSVMAVQGNALVRPPDRLRWTPLRRNDLVLPGDVVRTAPRGAHALELDLGGATALLGPGASVQVRGPRALHLRQGVLEVKAAEEAPIVVTGAGGFEHKVTGTLWATSDGREAKALPSAPTWLKRYRASTSNEWMGTLLANVDGREVSLAVGSYNVVAEVRDQIARTTIEQGFVNTTNATLEGVFYFPLPAGASISGFGMWIGDELVEADIVERQRARQIYEDILRRRKDPGLLEWEGGNLFKARVFPIFPHSTKRIRIRYTQVLPLQGRTFRYQHALRSELLRSKPLRELNVVVRVDASAGIEQVASPTHDVHIQKTDTTAEVRFDAQEFTPENDLEVLVRLKRPPPLALLPHRRGEDGYFLLQVSPPGAETGGWERDLVPESDPMEILVVADTSGSMDPAARRTQRRFLAALGALLGERDRIRLMAYDVAPVWIAEQPMAPQGKAYTNALDALDARRSLGWSDIDQAMAAAAKVAPEHGFVLYLGDGIGTTGDANPQVLADRLRAAHAGLAVHCVAPSSTYETPVLEALASLGAGSVREVGSQPSQTAATLLGEALRPLVRNLRVSIDGVRTARVYPETLPNLPVGMQQSVLGRFEPSDEPQEATVVVSGDLNGQPVTWRTQLTMPATDGGNSFLPRLWARKHIDALLTHGTSAEKQAEIVEFSERFGVMTPYTSFLVLESDEDRERYGVTRRVRMRDGERFFAEARDKVALEARRDAVRRASGWRTRQRHDVLRELARLGRDLPVPYPYEPVTAYATTGMSRSGSVGHGGGAGGRWSESLGALRDSALPAVEAVRLDEATTAVREELLEAEAPAEGSDGAAPAGAVPPPTSPPVARARKAGAKSMMSSDDRLLEDGAESDLDDFVPPDVSSFALAREVASSRRGYYAPHQRGPGSYSIEAYRRRTPWPQPPQPWLPQSLGFPPLPPPFERAEEDREDPPWDEEVTKLLYALVRRGDIAAEGRGLHARFQSHQRHPRRSHVTASAVTEAWIGHGQWRFHHRSHRGEPSQTWVVDGQRGALYDARHLARRRPAKAQDAEAWSLPLWDLGVHNPVHRMQDQGYDARITARDGDRLTLTFTPTRPHHAKQVWIVDTARRVVLATRTIDATGKEASRTVRGGHVLIGARYYPTQVEYRREERVTRTVTIAWTALDDAAFAAAVAPVRTLPEAVWVLEGTLPSEVKAKQARHDGNAKLADWITLTLTAAGRSQWDDALAAWSRVQGLVANRDLAKGWAHLPLLVAARQGDALKAQAQALVPAVLTRTDESAGALGDYVSRHVAPLGGNERLTLHDALAGAWGRDDGTFGADLAKQRRLDGQRLRASRLDAVGRNEEARSLRAQIARDNPVHLHDQLAHVRDFTQVGAHEDALRHLRTVASREPWSDAECMRLYEVWTQRLWALRRLDDLAATSTAWAERVPTHETPHVRAASTKLLLGRDAEADAWIDEQIAMRPGADLPKEGRARLGAAVQLTLGNGWHFHNQQLLPEPADRLAALALHLSRLTGDNAHWAYGLVQRIASDWRFNQTDAARVLREARLQDLVADNAIETMDVARLEATVRALPWSREAAEAPVWRSVVDRLRARWEKVAPAEARRIATLVLLVLDAHQEPDEALAFVRMQLERTVDAHRPTVRENLIGRLFARKQGGTAIEDELVGHMAAAIAHENHVNNRRGRAAECARLLALRMQAWRVEAALGPPVDRGEGTREARAQRNREAKRQARLEVAARLEAIAKDAGAVWRPWLRVERLGYALQGGNDVVPLAAEARAVLDRDGQRNDDPLDRLLRERAAVALAYACARSAAPETLRTATIDRFRKGWDESPKGEDAKPLLNWQHQLWRLLIALDRPEALAEVLRTWVHPDKVESRWRIALGYLEAELGRLPEAITQLAAARAHQALGAQDLRFLATLHLVRGEDEARRAALDAALGRESQWQLVAHLRRATRQVSRRGAGVAQELDPQVLSVVRVLMRKASNPDNALRQVVRLYKPTKDHRILAAVAEGLPGHTQEAMYRCLSALERLLRDVHEEATLDVMQQRLQALIEIETRTADRRGLRLALARAASRAAQVQETDPAHGTRALAALAAAWQDPLVAGEPRLLAGYLAGLQRIPDPAFSAQVRAKVQALFDGTQPGASDRVAIGLSASRVDWTYDERERALGRLTHLIREVRASEGRVPLPHRALLDQTVTWLVAQRAFRVGEQLLLEELGSWQQPQRRRQLREQLATLYVEALLHGASTTRGRGRALFDAVGADFEREMLRDPAQSHAWMQRFVRFIRRVHDKRVVSDVGTYLEDYATNRFPSLARRAVLASSNLARGLADALRRVVGHRASLAFLLRTYDTQPRFLRRMQQDVWSRIHNMFARDRHEIGPNLKSLEAPLLALVLRALERGILSGQPWRGSAFWHKSNRWYWGEKEQDFADVAHRLAETEAERPTVVVTCARLLYEFLGRTQEGIDVLRAAYERGGLTPDHRSLLCGWYEQQRQFVKGIPIAQALVAEVTTNLHYRLMLARLHLGARQAPQALQVLQDTEARWKEARLWAAPVAAELGHLAATDQLPREGVAWLEEALRLRQEARGNRGGQDTTAARWYEWLAQGRSALGDHRGAFKAATAALVATPTNNRRRQRDAQTSVRRTIERAPVLLEIVRAYDAEVEDTGVDAAVLRRLFAEVLLSKKHVEPAIAQLRAARALDERDARIHELLVQALDRAGRSAEATDALYGAIRLAPHNLENYKQLAMRYARQKDAAQAERAHTTLVEMNPHQPEGHRALAGVREAANDHAGAREQWAQVVRTHPLDPTGWLALGASSARTGDTDAAKEAYRRVIGGTWEERFGNVKDAAAEALAVLKSR